MPQTQDTDENVAPVGEFAPRAAGTHLGVIEQPAFWPLAPWRMVAYRQTFRELLGDVRIEDETDDRTLPVEQADAEPAAERDFAAEIAAAETLEALDEIDKAARAMRAFTPDAAGTALHRAHRDRVKTIAEAAWTPNPIEQPVGETADQVGARVASLIAPRDYLPPQNRAERRKAARRKGGKR